jgi:hypothetical protein
MPLSNYLHIPAVLHFACGLDPRRVLDVGVGMGAYGFLLRQYLDIAHERVARADWQVTLHGVEVFEGYRNPIWQYAYDQVIVADIVCSPVTDSYDLIVCNDVLEHMDRKIAVSLVGEFLKHAPVLIATTPNCDIPQGAWGGNEAETHRCVLAPEDFPGLEANIKTGLTTCYVCVADDSAAKKVRALAASCPNIETRRRQYNPLSVARSLINRITGR